MPGAPSHPSQDIDAVRVARQNQVLQLLVKMSDEDDSFALADVIGVASAFLLHCAHNHRTVFRRVMNDKVIHEGFSGVSLLTELKRFSQ